MPDFTNLMGLATWDQPLDRYDFDQLSNNWQILDFHDHSPGRGVAIPRNGIASGAVGPAQLGSDIPWIPSEGTLVTRPLAGVFGRTFYATDTGQWFADNGTSWQVTHPLFAARTVPSGTVTAKPNDLINAAGGVTVTLPNAVRDATVAVLAFSSVTGSSPVTVQYGTGGGKIFGPGMGVSGQSSFLLGSANAQAILQCVDDAGNWSIIAGRQNALVIQRKVADYTATPTDWVDALPGVTVTLPVGYPGALIAVTADSAVTGAHPVTVAGTKIYGVGLANPDTSFLLGAGVAPVILAGQGGGTWNIIAGQQDTGWIDITGASTTGGTIVPWGDGPNGPYPASYRKCGDQVLLSGSYAFSGPFATVTLGTNLPAPAHDVTIQLPVFVGTTGFWNDSVAFGLIEGTPNLVGQLSSTSGSTNGLSLDGLSYRLN